MMFIETYETSSLVLNNVLYNLSKNQHVQKALRQEIDTVLAEGELTFDKLNSMQYLNAVYLGV